MEFFEAVEARKSVRKFTDEEVPESVMRRAFEAAVLAPNSSNMQTWNFYWVRNAEKKSRLVQLCLSQSAARTARELVVITAAPSYWKRSQPEIMKYIERVQAPKPVHVYYGKLIPVVYRAGWVAPIKWVINFVGGLFRPLPQTPATLRDLQEVSIKSAALAAENFVLALAAQGFASCMMEGFDERRTRRMLRLRRDERAIMVVGIGKEGPRGTWGPRFRIPLEQVVREI